MCISSSATSKSFFRYLLTVEHRSFDPDTDLESVGDQLEQCSCLCDTIDEAKSDNRSLNDERWSN